jgi:hypothetical protein
VADTRFLPLDFSKGLLESVEGSTLPSGWLSTLVNWQPEPLGGLRVRRGWSATPTTGAPATRKGRGIGHFSKYTPYQTPARVQSVTATGTTSVTPTWSQATVTGNLLVLVVIAQSGRSANTPAGWTKGPEVGTAGSVSAVIFYKQDAASTSGALAVTFTSTPSTCAAWLAEYSGMAPVAFDQSASSSGTSATPATGNTSATTQSVELCIGVLGDNRDERQSAATNSFTEVVDFGTTSLGLGGYEKVTTAVGVQSTSATTSTSDAWAGAIATFKAASSGITSGYYLVAHDGTTSYDIKAIDRADLAANPWASIESVTVVSTTAPVSFTMGLGYVFYSAPKFATIRKWDGVTASAVTASPPGRALAFHKNRLFSAGTDDAPYRLHYSAPNDPTDWTGAEAGTIDVSALDGEPIEDVTPFGDGLMIAKVTSLWFLSGNGKDTFVLERLQGGGGAPGRVIMPTPYGAVVAGRKHVWLINGGRPDLISRPIELSYGITGDFITCAYLDDHVYICDEGTGTCWVINLTTGTWHTETITPASTEGPAVVYNQDEKLLFAPQAATVGSLLSYRLMPGATRGRDSGLAETFAATSGELWPTGPDAACTPMFLHLQLRQRGGTAGDTGLSITPTYDGHVCDAIPVKPKDGGAQTFRERVPVGSLDHGAGIYSAKFDFAQALLSSEASAFDIEAAVLEVQVEKIR